MLGLDNPIHIAFLLVVLLLIFGAKRLPEMGRSLGEGLRGFKDSISGESPMSHMTATDDDDAPASELVAATPLHTAPAQRLERVERTPVAPGA